MLHKMRPLIQKMLSPLAKLLPKMSPNVVTVLSLIIGILASVFFYFGGPSFLIAAVAMLLLSGFCDLFDGVLARTHKKTSKKGDLLDHVFDRYIDIFLILGLTYGKLVNIHLGYLAAISILMFSYLGTQSQAISGQRLYAGFLGRAERIVLLMIFAIAQAILLWLGIGAIFTFTLMEWLMIYFIFGGTMAAIQRIFKIWKLL
ncbi:MAG: CDP-alcohol phosphatidyltransferase family protein [archaeon]